MMKKPSRDRCPGYHLQGRPDWQAAIRMVGLKSQVTDEKIAQNRDWLKKIGARIKARFSL